MNKKQQTILVLIIATLLLEFSSLTKLKKIWKLAFSGSEDNTDEPPVEPGKDNSCPAGYTYVASIKKCVKFGEVAT